MKRIAATLAAAAALTGCSDPYADEFNQPPPAPTREQHHEHTEGDTGPRRPAPDRLPPRGESLTTPRGVVSAFCWHWANWRWDQLDRHAIELAPLATGPLRRELSQQTRSGQVEATLHAERVEHQATVVAIDVKPGRARRRAVCVTREQQIERGHTGLAGRHVVYLAAVARSDRRWKVTRWEPQP